MEKSAEILWIEKESDYNLSKYQQQTHCRQSKVKFTYILWPDMEKCPFVVGIPKHKEPDKAT